MLPHCPLHRDADGYNDNADDARYTSTSAGHSCLHRCSQHYANHLYGGSRSRFASLSRPHIESSTKRSRKASTPTAPDLVRAVVHEKLEADSGAEVQLALANGDDFHASNASKYIGIDRGQRATRIVRHLAKITDYFTNGCYQQY